MATLRELIIKVSANSSSFQTEIARASRMGSDYYRTMQNGGRQAATATKQTQRALKELNAELISVRSSAAGMAGAFAGAFATHQLIQYADTWSQLSGRLRLASTSSEDFAAAQSTLMGISQRTGTSIEANTTLYSRIAASLRDAGYASKDVAAVTETVATSLKLSGASTEEASSVITQLSQALGSGVLRGEEFNAIMENGGRLAKLLANGMGTTVGELRNMAAAGKLTTDRIVPILTNVEQLREEFDTLPATVSGSAQKVQNSFMAWVGGANQASGASAMLAGTLDSVAENMNTVAAAAGALAAIGGARFVGGMLGNVGTQTAQLIDARKNEIALSAARAEAAIQSQRKAAADAIAAERAHQLATTELELAKNTNAEALATQNATAKRSALIAANATLAQSNKAVSASQLALNKATSAMSLVRSGAAGLLSLVGGIPGALMLGAGAWYMMYQKQEQARESALEYANTINDVRDSLRTMSVTQMKSNIGQANISLTEQNRAIDEQADKVERLRHQHEAAAATVEAAKNGLMVYTDVTATASRLASELAIEEGNLEKMMGKRKDTQKLIDDLTDQSVSKMAEMSGAVGSLAEMYSRLNTVTRQSTLMATPTYAGPVLSALDGKQQAAMDKAQRQNILAGLQGLEKARQQATFEADDLNLPSGQYEKYINLAVEGERKLEALRKSKPRKGSKTEEEKTADTYEKLIKQQKEQIALDGQNTELAKAKYQISQGELQTLTASQKQTLLQNAALIDQQKIRQQIAAYEANLADSNASARASNNAELVGYGQGSLTRGRMQEMLKIREEFEQKNVEIQRQYQGGEISESLYKQEVALNKKYLDERLRDQEGYYSASDAMRNDWNAGFAEGLSNWMDTASNYADQTASLVSNTMSGFVDTLSGALSGNKTSWEDWSKSVLQSMQKVILNAMLVNSIKGLGGAGFMSMFSGGASAGAGDAGGLFSSGAFDNLTLNAKGGAYASEGLSAYSNSIVNTPTYFAFAKGAGLMGEAGPEAIMPLTRSADGSLGVRMVGGESASGGNGDTIIHQHFNISGNGDAALRQAMEEAARKGANDGAKRARQDMLNDFQTRGQGRRLLGV
ncbi:MAG TPA: phage tail tape measure protein [Hafnia paralvei]|uniref:phage tail tape measure protein n=1 Tax=Hafnia paralvei TaxID=546367 RepID=UPI000EC31BAF|nr:phage tail tape measure protein [Hafnia paralvei]HCU15164.1 phage tail tape measure protein [Hafnia paralvei]